MECINDYSLPEVVEVRMMECRELQQGIIQGFIAGVQLFISCAMKTIPTYPGTKCQGVYNRSNNGDTQQTTLEFTTSVQPERTTGLAFAVRTPNDEWYLIGSRERPWPRVEITDDKGITRGDAAVKRVKVTFESLSALIPVTILD